MLVQQTNTFMFNEWFIKIYVKYFSQFSLSLQAEIWWVTDSVIDGLGSYHTSQLAINCHYGVLQR